MRRRTLVVGSLESPCRLLVKCNWTSCSISYQWRATRQNVSKLLLSGGCGQIWRVHLYEIFFGFYKTRHILLSDSANSTVLRAVILTQYRRVTDGRTDRQMDGRNCYSLYSACTDFLNVPPRIFIPIFWLKMRKKMPAFWCQHLRSHISVRKWVAT